MSAKVNDNYQTERPIITAEHQTICKKCGEIIEEGHAYELGEDRWHIECFKCTKCGILLGCGSNFLVLGNGGLICSDCSYSCRQCGKKIDDLAILTGDQAYCSSCFRCRACKQKIEDLRYARTSKGLFCMKCHEKLIAKKKKYEERKRLQAESQNRERDLHKERQEEVNLKYKSNDTLEKQLRNKLLYETPSGRQSTSLVQSAVSSLRGSIDSATDIVGRYASPSTSSLVTKDKALPIPPDTRAPAKETRDSNQELSRVGNSVEDQGKSSKNSQQNVESDDQEKEFSIEEVNDSDDELNMERSRRQYEKQQNEVANVQANTPSMKSNADSFTTKQSNPTEDDFVSHSKDVAPTTPHQGDSNSQPTSSLPSATRNELENLKNGSESPVSVSKTNFNGKNLFILSPSQHSENDAGRVGTREAGERGSLSSTQRNLDVNHLTPSIDDALQSKSPFSSPSGKLNRQAKIVEANDYSTFRPDWSYNNQENVESTPQKQKLSNFSKPRSPPPKLALPSVPLTPSTRDTSNKSLSPFTERQLDHEKTPKGLGLDGIDYKTDEDKVDEIPQRNNVPVGSPPSRGSPASNVIGKGTPLVTNLEPLPQPSSERPPENSSSLSRKPSILRTPKLGLKHKRSVSGGHGGLAGILGLNRNGSVKENKTHTRHVSDGQVANGAAAFITPPLNEKEKARNSPRLQDQNFANMHNRSTSDSSRTLQDTSDNGFMSNELEIRALKMEKYQLMSQKQSLFSETKSLESEIQKNKEILSSIKDKTVFETKKYEGLMKEIGELENTKIQMIQYNRSLNEQNKRLESGSFSSPSLSFRPQDSNDAIDEENTSSLRKLTSLDNGTNELLPNGDLTQEVSKTTRLKFWKKPKVSMVSNSSPAQNSQNSRLNIGDPNMPRGNTNRNPTGKDQKNSEAENLNKTLGGFMTKSVSTNILDTFLQSANLNRRDNNHEPSGVSNDKNSSGRSEMRNAPLFSSSLTTRANYENLKVPLILTCCIEEVEKRGLEVEGIYRISGGNSAIISIENTFANLPANPVSDDKYMHKLAEVMDVDINAVTSTLKRYLRKLPEPVISYFLYDDYIKVCLTNKSKKPQKKLDQLKNNVIQKLPPANKDALYIICKHLALVSSYFAINKMTLRNLSVVFAPTLAWDETGKKEMDDMGYRNDVTELMFNNFEYLFHD